MQPPSNSEQKIWDLNVGSLEVNLTHIKWQELEYSSFVNWRKRNERTEAANKLQDLSTLLDTVLRAVRMNGDFPLLCLSQTNENICMVLNKVFRKWQISLGKASLLSLLRKSHISITLLSFKFLRTMIHIGQFQFILTVYSVLTIWIGNFWYSTVGSSLKCDNSSCKEWVSSKLYLS